MSEHKCMQCTHGSVCDDFEGSHAKDCEFFEPENKWISVNDRLPATIDGSLDYSELVLVTANNNDRTYTYLAYFGSCNGFSGLFGGDWNNFVTHWQPLPQPPEDKEKEGL